MRCRNVWGAALFLAGWALSGVCWAAAAADDSPALAANGAAAHSYANATDEELTALGARWSELDSSQRRALLSEVKMRMARARQQGAAQGVLHIQLRRRYGAVPPTASGGQLRIRIVQGQQGVQQTQDTRPFGVGFEQRKGERTEPVDERRPADSAVKAADSD